MNKYLLYVKLYLKGVQELLQIGGICPEAILHLGGSIKEAEHLPVVFGINTLQRTC